MMRLLRNLRWGIGWGVVMAVGFSLFALLQYLLRGEQVFARLGLTFVDLIKSYLGAGVVCGTVIGFLRPITRWRWGGMLVGVLLTGIGYGAIFISFDGSPQRWPTHNWVVLGIVAIVFGIYTGNREWEEYVEPSQPPPPAGPTKPRPKFKIWNS